MKNVSGYTLLALHHAGTGKNAQNRYRDCMLKTTEIQRSSDAPIEISENEIASRLLNSAISRYNTRIG